ncbi:MAG TPA: hypothetical protein VJ723_02740, partial [Candidatus Angelobacter sp.]|nr:hypothetical protein [Candidatus Angelobacter sp.]
MITFDPAEEAASHGRWMPPVAGLFVAFCVAWGLCPVPPDHPLYLDDVLVLTAIPVLATVLTCGTVVWLACAALRRGVLDARSAALRTAATAVWLPPLVLLAISRSWWAAVLSIVFAASASRLLRFYEMSSFGVTEPQTVSGFSGHEVFRFVGASAFSARMLWPFLIATCVQLGGAAGLAGYRFEATTFLGMSTGMLTWFAATSAIDAGRERPARRMTVLRLLALTALSMILTAGGLVQYLALTGGFAQGSIA